MRLPKRFARWKRIAEITFSRIDNRSPQSIQIEWPDIKCTFRNFETFVFRQSLMRFENYRMYDGDGDDGDGDDRGRAVQVQCKINSFSCMQTAKEIKLLKNSKCSKQIEIEVFRMKESVRLPLLQLLTLIHLTG